MFEPLKVTTSPTDAFLMYHIKSEDDFRYCNGLGVGGVRNRMVRLDTYRDRIDPKLCTRSNRINHPKVGIGRLLGSGVSRAKGTGLFLIIWFL